MAFNINTALDTKQPIHFKCPYCGGHSMLNRNNSAQDDFIIRLSGSKYDDLRAVISVATCVNSNCGELTLGLYLETGEYYPPAQHWDSGEVLRMWTILPESSARPQPDYIPSAIRKSYTEACRIKELSPTASATLSRRCLQAMIHDYWGIERRNLFDEIEALPDEVSQETLDAIHAVRKIGNIGAHMKLNTNDLGDVDVDVNEAATMIDLIELLFEGWYVDRYNKSERLRKMTAAIEARESGNGSEPEVTESND